MQSSLLGGDIEKEPRKCKVLNTSRQQVRTNFFCQQVGIYRILPVVYNSKQSAKQLALTSKLRSKVIASHSLFTTQLPPFGRERCLKQRTTASPSAAFVSTFCWRNGNSLSLVKQHLNNFHERHHAVVTGMRTSTFQTQVVNTRGQTICTFISDVNCQRPFFWRAFRTRVSSVNLPFSQQQQQKKQQQQNTKEKHSPQPLHSLLITILSQQCFCCCY